MDMSARASLHAHSTSAHAMGRSPPPPRATRTSLQTVNTRPPSRSRPRTLKRRTNDRGGPRPFQARLRSITRRVRRALRGRPGRRHPGRIQDRFVVMISFPSSGSMCKDDFQITPRRDQKIPVFPCFLGPIHGGTEIAPETSVPWQVPGRDMEAASPRVPVRKLLFRVWSRSSRRSRST